MAGHALRGAGLVLLLAAVGVGAVLANGRAWLSSPWGSARLTRAVEELFSRPLAGELRIGTLRPRGIAGLSAEHVIITDDLGRPTIAVRALELELDPLALLAGRLEIEELVVRGGRVEIAQSPQDGGAVSIDRAFRPVTPRPKRPKGLRRRLPLPPKPFRPLVLESLIVEDTAFRLTDGGPGPPQVLVTGIGVTASGRWSNGATVRLEGHGDAQLPLRAPLGVGVGASFSRDLLVAEHVKVTLGTTRVELLGSGRTGELASRLQLHALVGAAEARAMGVPLASDVPLEGTVLLSRPRVAADLRAALGEAGIVDLRVALEPRAKRLVARAELVGVDPGAWLLGGPPGRVFALAMAAGRPFPPFDLRGSLDLRESIVGGEPVSGWARVHLAGTALRADEVRLRVPGALVTASGKLSPLDLDVAARLESGDLAELTAFARRAGVAAPELRGEGVAEVELSGSPRAPELEVHVMLPLVASGRLEARGVDVHAAGHLGPDRLPAGHASGSARQLQAAGFAATDVRLNAARDDGGRFVAHARGSTPLGPAELHATGRSSRDRTELRAATLATPEGELVLRGPARIEHGREGFAIRELRVAGPGGLRAELDLEAGRVRVDLSARDLPLDRLPRGLVPGQLAGRLTADVRLSGTLAAPEGRARLTLRQGSVGELSGVEADADLRLDAGRVRGSALLRVPSVGMASVELDAPLRPAAAPAGAKLRLSVLVPQLRLAALGEALGTALPAGVVVGRLLAEGTVAKPRVELEAHADDLRPPDDPRAPPLSARVTAVLEDGEARLDATAWAAARRVLELSGEAPVDPRRAIRDPGGTLRSIVATRRSRVRAELRGVDLALVGRLVRRPDLAGAAAARLDLMGPLRDPRGELDLSLAAATIPGLGRIAGRIEAQLEEDRSRAAATLSVEGQEPASVLLELGAPVATLLAEGAAPDVPISLVLHVPEWELGRRPGPGRALEVGAIAGARLAGRVEARGRAQGTLASLAGELRVVARGISARGVELGDLELAVEHGRELVARVHAVDPAVGTLEGRLRLPGPLPLQEVVRHGLRALLDRDAEAFVVAHALSAAPFAIVPQVLRAEGQLDASARARGPLRELHRSFEGELRLDRGRVELLPGQTFEGIAVEAALRGETVDVRRLVVRAPGRGVLSGTGTYVIARGAHPFGVDLQATAFPVSGPGGIVARVDLRGRLAGTLGRKQGLQARLELEQGRVELPPRQPRQIQAAGRNRDVLVVSGPEARRRRAGPEQAWPLELRLVAPEILLDGQDVTGHVSANVVLRRGPDGTYRAAGLVRARDARIEALGRPFQIESAVARWDGEPLGRPELQVTARYEGREATAWVDVAGTPADPEIRLRSEPPLPEPQIALLIASGRSAVAGLPGEQARQEQAPEEAGEGQVGTAVSVAGSFLGQRLRQAIGPKLPIDVLALRSGEAGAQLEAGTYVGARFYLGYVRDFLPAPGENTNEIRAEYDLSRTLSLQSRFGDAGTGGLDLVFERSIPSPSQRRVRRQRQERPAPAPIPGTRH